jgi:hypothetical protein
VPALAGSFYDPTVSVPEWTAADEIHRLDHIAGVVFEGSVALAAAAAVTAFQVEGKTLWLAVLIAVLSALPGYIAAWTLLLGPRPTSKTPQAGLERKADLVHGALIGLLTAVPLVALLVSAVVLFPEQVGSVVGGPVAAGVGLVVFRLITVSDR